MIQSETGNLPVKSCYLEFLRWVNVVIQAREFEVSLWWKKIFIDEVGQPRIALSWRREK